MNEVISEVLFNRVLIWFVMASLEHDNKFLRGAYIGMAILNVVKSLKAYMEDA